MEDPRHCAIIVSSCDAYSDAWMPFFTLFFRYWPDCPFQIYLISTGATYDDPRVRTIAISPDHGWADNMTEVLARIGVPYFLYLQEDYFLTRAVNTARVLELLGVLKHENAACLKLYPAPRPDLPYKSYKDIGAIGPSVPYRISLQAALWNTESFLELVRPGERGADMEHKGSLRAVHMTEPILSVRPGRLFPYDRSAALIYLATGILKGHWHRDVLSLFKKEHIDADLTRRPLESRADYLQHLLTSLPLVGSIFRLFYRARYKTRSLLRGKKFHSELQQ